MFTKQIAGIALAASFALGSFVQPASAQQQPQPAQNVKTEALIMLQNEGMMTARIPNIKEMGAYLKGVREAFGASYEKAATPETINAVVAVKPGHKARLWLVSSLQNQPDRSDLMTRFQALPVPEVKDGPVAFAFSVTIAGAQRKKLPWFPPEWNAAFGGKQVAMPDAITTYIWKD